MKILFRPAGKVLWLLLAMGVVGKAQGTGYFGPYEFYSDESRLGETPEFYWETEVKRMAMDFHPAEKPLLIERNGASGDAGLAPMEQATANADAADFADALKTGEIKPADADATEDESDSEFADYIRGASAYRLGAAPWADARKAWLALLARPAAQRHYRTVWAAFMLGKIAMKSGDPSASEWFEKTREYAKQGFADSLGLAADSYGWEGRSEWKQGHPQKAAPLFLTQLALGDESAVVSLKALIPDRFNNFNGMLNYDDDLPPVSDTYPPPPPPAGAAKAALDRKIEADLEVMVHDPLLRKLETVHILATESGGQDLFYNGNNTMRSQRWLKVVEAAHLGKVEDAAYLGWVAYTVGDYDVAQRWLDLSDPAPPVAEWLRARLDLRAGKVEDAAKAMAAVWDALRSSPLYMAWNVPERDDRDGSIFDGNLGGEYESDYSTMQWASADLGAVHLLRSDFMQALDTLIKGHLREDAAYVAERVLTTAELKAYVDRMPPPGPPSKIQPWLITDISMDDTTWLRYLLARRLVREDRYAEAVPYMPPAYGKLLQKYADALRNGADPQLSKAVRADNLSTAAWLARFDGMELMGTEVWPDGFDSGGAFEDTDLASERMEGSYSSYDNKNNKTIPVPIPQPVSSGEKERLRENQIKPNVRFHYRVIASALALKAAALMDDNTEELADALNKAGIWSDERDDKLANHCYALIEKRCANTTIGQAALGHHWFVDQMGPWSTPLEAQQEALHKQFGIVDDQQ